MSQVSSCPKPCTFEARCEGDVLVTCSVASDQMFGDGIRRDPCAAPNPRCVEPAPNQARCVADPAETCAAETPDQCRGDLLLYCEDGFLMANDCRNEGPNCTSLPTGGVQCARVPLESCDAATFDGTCEGQVATRCTDGYVVAVDCDALGLACGDMGTYGVCVR